MTDADTYLVELSERFEIHAIETDEYYTNGRANVLLEHAEERRLAETERALVEAAASVQHRTNVGREAKERMLAHLNRWAETTTTERSLDGECYGDRLAWSLMRSAA